MIGVSFALLATAAPAAAQTAEEALAFGILGVEDGSEIPGVGRFEKTRKPDAAANSIHYFLPSSKTYMGAWETQVYVEAKGECRARLHLRFRGETRNIEADLSSLDPHIVLSAGTLTPSVRVPGLKILECHHISAGLAGLECDGVHAFIQPEYERRVKALEYYKSKFCKGKAY